MSYPETLTEAWEARFGQSPPPEAEQVASFFLHRSVRKFSDRPVEESTVTALVAAAQSAATSSNLQMWSVVSVQDPDRREQIAKLSGAQGHVREAPWFFAFLADHHRLRQVAARAGEKAEGLGYVEYLIMALIDVALAAERFVCAAESLGLGICYIGALRNDPVGVKDLLGLPSGVFGAFGLTLGWPEEPLEAHIKPRLDTDDVWFRERYRTDVDVSGYEDRMRDFYESEDMGGDRTWSKRSGRRVDRNHLTGREVLFSWLQSQGMNLE